jgi:hypothetical protein
VIYTGVGADPFLALGTTHHAVHDHHRLLDGGRAERPIDQFIAQRVDLLGLNARDDSVPAQ